MAPCFVKFYKYEEIKKKYKMQNQKDLLRQRLHDKMKEQRQLSMDRVKMKYRVDANIVRFLSRAEQQVLKPKSNPG